MACRARIQAVLEKLDRWGVRSDARGRRYAAATVSDYSRPRPAPRSSTARYRRPHTQAPWARAIVPGLTGCCRRTHTRGPLQQPLPLPPRSAYLHAATAARPWGGCAHMPARAPARQPLQPPPSARQCAAPPANKPASPPARVPDHTPAQPLQPPPTRPRTCCMRSAARTWSSRAPQLARCSTACSARCAGAASPCSRTQTAIGSLTRIYAQGVQLALREISFYFKHKTTPLSLVRLRSRLLLYPRAPPVTPPVCSPTHSSLCLPGHLPTCRQGSPAPPLSYKSPVVVYILCIYNPFNVFNVGIMQLSS